MMATDEHVARIRLVISVSPSFLRGFLRAAAKVAGLRIGALARREKPLGS
jgi:hypothetical protein